MMDIAKLKAAAERAKAAVADYQSGVIDAAEFHRRAAASQMLVATNPFAPYLEEDWDNDDDWDDDDD